MVLLYGLVGCGLFGEQGRFRDRKHDYRNATSIEPLEMPPGVQGEVIEDIYYVPPINAGTQASPSNAVPRPQPLLARDSEDLVKIQTLGQREWILVQLLPGQVWPRMKDFLLVRRMGVGNEVGALGIMDTPWLQEPQQAYREMYRFHLTQGVQRNTAEIHVGQVQRRGSTGRAPQPPDPWPLVSDDLQRERLMLQRFARFLADTADANAAVSLMAQGINTSERLYMIPGANPSLRLNLSPDRAWASLGRALGKANFKVLGESKDTGIYDVSFKFLEGEK